MTMREAAEAMNGEVIRGDADALFSGAVLDSRAVRQDDSEPGQLFFALEGEATDGHRFVEQALAQGAAGAVVRAMPSSAENDPEGPKSGTLIQVADTYVALHALTRKVRESTPKHLVAITGSAGKTTTKELLTAMLEQKFVTAPSPGNFNNLFGFPLALMSIANDTEWMVAEMGMSTPGELGGVSRLGKPEIGVFTNVRHAHVEGFEKDKDPNDVRTGEEMITDAKAELLQGLDPSGVVVVNADDPHTLEIARRHLERGESSGLGRSIRVLGFHRSSADREAENQALSDALAVLGDRIEIPLHAEELSTTAEGHRLRLHQLLPAKARKDHDVQDPEDVFLPLHGAVNIENFLAAATCAHFLGVSLKQIADSVAGTSLPPGRGGSFEVCGALVIDDSYNSNPSALERALRAAAKLATDSTRQRRDSRDRRDSRGRSSADPHHQRTGRLWAVLGEMKELGSQGPDLHRQMGELAGALGYEQVVGVGEMARELLAGASEAGSKVRWFADAEEARAVAKTLTPGDVVLVKGSRSVGLEAVIDAMKEEDSRQPGGDDRVTDRVAGQRSEK